MVNSLAYAAACVYVCNIGVLWLHLQSYSGSGCITQKESVGVGTTAVSFKVRMTFLLFNQQ